jgi:amino acid transporter
VGILAVIYILSQVGLQGVVSPSRLQNNSSSVLVYVAQALGGGGWAKVMALALALSVAASVGVGIVSLSRISYGMATHRVLPMFLGNVNRRFATPMVASIVMGVSITALTWVYLLSGSIANLFTQLISVDGLLYAGFYVLTAFAAIAYYRRRIFSNVWDGLLTGLLPVGAIAFLVWIIVKSTQTGTSQERWSLIGITAAGLLVMLAARYILRSSFFQTPRESAPSLKARSDH